jgi:hypothetical protein
MLRFHPHASFLLPPPLPHQSATIWCPPLGWLLLPISTYPQLTPCRPCVSEMPPLSGWGACVVYFGLVWLLMTVVGDSGQLLFVCCFMRPPPAT